MTATLLPVTGVLVVVAAAFFVISFRRRDAAPSLAGMTVMIVATIPAVVYGSV
jgi:hypothetical protein